MESDYHEMWGADQCTHPEVQPVLGSTYFISYVLISNAVLLSVFLGIISISLEVTVGKQKFHDAQVKEVHYFRKLFPGNLAKINAFYHSFLALDVGNDGFVSSFELAMAYSIVTGIDVGELEGSANFQKWSRQVGPAVTSMITRWVREIDKDDAGDKKISLKEYMQFMTLKHIERDGEDFVIKGRGCAASRRVSQEAHRSPSPQCSNIPAQQEKEATEAMEATEASSSQDQPDVKMIEWDEGRTQPPPPTYPRPGPAAVTRADANGGDGGDGDTGGFNAQVVMDSSSPLRMGNIEDAIETMERATEWRENSKTIKGSLKNAAKSEQGARRKEGIGGFFAANQPTAVEEHWSEVWDKRLAEPADTSTGQLTC
jgi:hypothetical protein